MAVPPPIETGVPTPLDNGPYRLAFLVAAGTLGLLTVGGIASLTTSSPPAPGWLATLVAWLPGTADASLYAALHQVLALAVGVGMLVLAVWLWRKDERAKVKAVVFLGLVLLAVQALLGMGLGTGLLPYPRPVLHALAGHLFFAVTVALSQVTSPGWFGMVRRRFTPKPGSTAFWAMVSVLALLAAAALGSAVRHYGATLAIPTFPLAEGRILPPLDNWPVVVHFAHRVAAVAVAVAVLMVVWQTLRRHGDEPLLMGPALALGALVVGQWLLGANVVWSEGGLSTTVLHQVTGALSLGLATLLYLRAKVLEK